MNEASINEWHPMNQIERKLIIGTGVASRSPMRKKHVLLIQ